MHRIYLAAVRAVQSVQLWGCCMMFRRSLAQLELETVWRSKVNAAEQRYHAAVAHYYELLREREGSFIPAPDGADALQQATREKASAMQDYLRLLTIYSQLMENGEAPSEE